ncbi:SpoIIE family protein phosphatase [Lutibacter sp. B2]|nr:SpoIIE family protein phosphatase [Lutibacter sp. B2]
MCKNYSNKHMNQMQFSYDILSGMKDWVRVVDQDNNILFINEAMRENLGNIVGQKCFNTLHKDTPCEYCISNIGIKKKETIKKQEVIDGKIYSVVSSPVWNDGTQSYCAVEVFRDITEQKAMENLILTQNQKMKQDLEFAKRLQLKTLPKDGIYNDFKISSKYIPSELLGGDLYDVVCIDANHTGIYIADVSGHGVTASMMTMFIKQTIKNLGKKAIDPASTLAHLYQQYQELGIDVRYYITILYAVYDKEKNILTCANAGHNCMPIIINNKGVKEIECEGIPICRILEEASYHQKSIEFNKGDKILLYTDGISESFNEDEGFFTNERVVKMCQENKGKNIALLIYKLAKKIKQFSNDEIKDDVAMLAAEII